MIFNSNILVNVLCKKTSSSAKVRMGREGRAEGRGEGGGGGEGEGGGGGGIFPIIFPPGSTEAEGGVFGLTTRDTFDGSL